MSDFNFFLEQFSDVKIMRYQVPGFDELSLQQKKLVYYLSEAALCGRDIIFDQNYKHNLKIRRTLETIYKNFTGDRGTKEFHEFVTYLKKVWFSNGIHHHYSTDKFFPKFSRKYFSDLVMQTENTDFEQSEYRDLESFISELTSVMFDPELASKRVSLDSSRDLVKESACNFYDGVTQEEAETFYSSLKNAHDTSPVSYGLNAKLVKKENQIQEVIYKVGGLYSGAIEKIVSWLEKALEVTDNQKQHDVILKLIEFYKTGDLTVYDDYNISWVNDLESKVDFVNGFTEVYGDPLGMKATWESVVNFQDDEATKRTVIISENAQWFEDHSPVDSRFKKKKVKGVSAKVITVAHLGGDCYPSTPIGINLPNSDWIRKEHGSKSVTMDNITYAYDQVSQGSGFLEEFCYSQKEIELSKKHGYLAGSLHTDLHECLGHGSGQPLPGTNPEALKNYASALEEARADLFALYYMMDTKLVDLGLMSTLDVAKAEYNGYIRNGLMTQLTRVEEGKEIEQAHMRNRQLISKWCFEKGSKDNVIEQVTMDEITFFKVNDHNKLRDLFGELLKEVQRIKSEGDYKAGKLLVETYGVKVDQDLHKEVKDRFAQLNIAPYGGFVNPVFELEYKNEKISDVKVNYSENYSDQMMRYSEEYSYL